MRGLGRIGLRTARQRRAWVTVVAAVLLVGALPAAASVAADDAEPAVSIVGTVRDATGAPVAGLTVTVGVVQASGGASYEFGIERTTGADGTYVVEGRRPETQYRVRLQDPAMRYLDAEVDVVTSADGAATADAVVDLGGRVAGVITGPGGEVFSPWVFAEGVTMSAYEYDVSTGRYIALLPAGDYQLWAQSAGLVPEYYDGAFEKAQAAPVHVVAGQETSGIDFALSAGGTLSGVVRDTAGRPIAGAEVVADRSGPIGGQAHTDAQGRFTITSLLGEVSVCVRAEGYIQRAYPQPRCNTPGGVDVREGETADIAVTLPRPATVQGRVTGPAGEAIAGVDVTVRSGSEFAIGTTAADGTYVVTGVVPGTFEVIVLTPFGSPYVSQLYDWQPYNSQPFIPRGPATPVTVTEGGAVAGIDVQLWHEDLSRVFTDVPETHPFVREIAWMKARGISTGNANGTYGPTASVTREAMAAFLYRMAGRPAYTPPTTTPFIDVSRSHPFYKEICWLAASGISTGWPDRTFRPGVSVERQAMAAFLYRFAGSPAFTPPAVSPFRDVRTTDPFYKEIAWLESVGVAGGYADDGYHPTAAVDRQAMAAFLNRLDRRVLG